MYIYNNYNYNLFIYIISLSMYVYIYIERETASCSRVTFKVRSGSSFTVLASRHGILLFRFAFPLPGISPFALQGISPTAAQKHG